MDNVLIAPTLTDMEPSTIILLSVTVLIMPMQAKVYLHLPSLLNALNVEWAQGY